MRMLLRRMHVCVYAADTSATQVAGQLSSNGVVEAVKLAQAGGLPTRYNYDELWDRKGMDMGVLLRAHWRRTGTQFPCFTSTNAHMCTLVLVNKGN
jgi:hypothetical protein